MDFLSIYLIAALVVLGLMTMLLMRVSGVTLLEKMLKTKNTWLPGIRGIPQRAQSLVSVQKLII